MTTLVAQEKINSRWKKNATWINAETRNWLSASRDNILRIHESPFIYSFAKVKCELFYAILYALISLKWLCWLISSPSCETQHNKTKGGESLLLPRYVAGQFEIKIYIFAIALEMQNTIFICGNFSWSQITGSEIMSQCDKMSPKKLESNFSCFESPTAVFMFTRVSIHVYSCFYSIKHPSGLRESCSMLEI